MRAQQATDPMVRIVALRWSDARGWMWTRERECPESLAPQWLAIYRADEPAVQFSTAKAAK